MSAPTAPGLPDESPLQWAHDGLRALARVQKQGDEMPISEFHVSYASMLAFLPLDAVRSPVLADGVTYLGRHYCEAIKNAGDSTSPTYGPCPPPGFRLQDLPSARLWATPSPDSPLGVRAWLALRRHHDLEPIGVLARLAELAGFGSSWSGYRFVFNRPESWVVFQILMNAGLGVALNPAEQASAERLVSHLGERIERLPIDLRRDGKMLLESQVIHWPVFDPDWGVQWVWGVPYASYQHETIKNLGCIWSKDHSGWVVRAGKDPLEVAERMLKACNRRAIFLLPSRLPEQLSDFQGFTPHFPGPVASERVAVLKRAYSAMARCRISAPGVEATGEIITEGQAPVAYLDVPYSLRRTREQVSVFPGARFCTDRKQWALTLSRLNAPALSRLRGITWRSDPNAILAGCELPGFGTLSLFDDGFIELATPYHPDLVQYIRRRVDPLDKGWDKEQRVWRFRIAEPEVPDVLATVVQRFELDVVLPDGSIHSNATAVAKVKEVGEQLVSRYAESYQADSDYAVPGLKLAPFPFQRAGMAYVRHHGSCLIADDCGLGKTVQAIGALLDHDAFPVLVLCPAIARLTWRMELAKFTDKVTPDEVLIVGVDEKREDRLAGMMKGKRVIICGYNGLKRYHSLLADFAFKAAVLDESHYIKNPESQRGQLSRELLTPGPMDLRLLLSATPYTDRPSQLINQLEAIGKLDLMGGADYIRSLDDLPEDRRGPALERFNRRLRSTCMIRRIKAEVMADMPDVLVQMVPCELTGNYQQAETAYARMMLQSVLEALDAESLVRLRESADGAPEALVETVIRDHLTNARQATQSLHIAEIARLRHQLGTEKIRSVTQWIRNFFSSTAETEKLVVFARHIDVQKAVAQFCREAGIEMVTITGDMNPEARKASEIAFQEGTARCCVASIVAASENITLTAANHVMFAEQDYSGGVMIQARDRLIRIGQKAATVNVYFAIMANSLDGNMSRSITRKMEMITQGLGDGHDQAGLSRESTLDSLAEILRRHPGKAARFIRSFDPEEAL